MGRTKNPFPPAWTMADLVEQLGGISLSRIRMTPLPGQATERDVLAILDRENRLYELVDGTLVEKTRGYSESCIAALLSTGLAKIGVRIDSCAWICEIGR